MKTRLMTVHRVEPPTVAAGAGAACAEMRRLQAEGKLQELPPICAPGNRLGPQRAPTPAKKSLGI